MKNHKTHNVLGNYCWTCQRPTVAGIPGWPKASRNDAPMQNDNMPSMVVWADGVEDTQRVCIICNTTSCKMPVHAEEYGESRNFQSGQPFLTKDAQKMNMWEGVREE